MTLKEFLDGNAKIKHAYIFYIFLFSKIKFMKKTRYLVETRHSLVKISEKQFFVFIWKKVILIQFY